MELRLHRIAKVNFHSICTNLHGWGVVGLLLGDDPVMEMLETGDSKANRMQKA